MTLAFVTSGGSPNAHTAIFARTLGIPAVVNLGVSLLPSYEGREVIVDGESGKVYVDPDEATRVKVMERQEAEKSPPHAASAVPRQTNAGAFGRNGQAVCQHFFYGRYGGRA